jgi:protein SCO1/2
MFDHSRKLQAVRVICAAILTLISGCKQAPKTKHYPISGKILGKSVSTQQITLDAGDVPGFMPAMTMAYNLPNAAVLEELQPGDRIAAQLAVDPADTSHFWIEDVVITAEVAHNEPPARLPPHELLPGEAIPDVVMVDQDDKTFHLRDYKGKAVLLTFIYTRCPMPTYCPMITSHFSRIHDALKKNPNLYAHSQLVSITLDPDYDAPPVMKKYGLAYVDGSADDLKTWTFASTKPDDLKKLASAFGLEYFQDGNQISHSMSTVLLAKDGRVAQVWKGNDWKWDDLLAATERAAQK